MDAVVFDGTRFVAVGTQENQAAKVWLSNNGETWHELSQGRISGGTSIHKIVSTRHGLVAVGWDSASGDMDATVWLSSTGSEWTRDVAHGTVFAGPPDTRQEMWAVTEFRGGLIAVGWDDRRGDPDAAIWRYDDRGWHSPVVLGRPGNQMIRAVVPGGPGLVAVGYDGSTGSKHAAVGTSEDGATWNEVSGLGALPAEQLNGVVAFRDGLVAVGANGPRAESDVAVWTSSDGLAWKASTATKLGGPGSQFAHGVVVFEGKLVVVGSDGHGSGEDAAVWGRHPGGSPWQTRRHPQPLVGRNSHVVAGRPRKADHEGCSACWTGPHPPGQLGPGAEAELPVDPGEVPFDGLH